MINMNSSNEKITINDVKKFELEHNVILSEEYIDFLLNFNGGYPKLSTFKISDEEGESLVNKFYGIGDMKSNLTKVFEILEGELPEGFISIGDDPGGNEICLGISDKYDGEIYYWIHDMESDGEMDNMFFLANNFKEFIENLYEIED